MCGIGGGDPGGIGGGATGRGGMHGFEADDAAVGIGGGSGGNVGRDAVVQGARGHNLVNTDTPFGNKAAISSDADFSGINADISRAMDTSLQGDFRGMNRDIETALLGETNPAAIQNDFAAISAEMEAVLNEAQADPDKKSGLEKVLHFVFTALQTTTDVLLSGFVTKLGTAAMNGLGVNAKSAAAAIDGLNNGVSPGDIAGSLGPGDMDGPTGGGPGDIASGGNTGGTSGPGGTGGTGGRCLGRSLAGLIVGGPCGPRGAHGGLVLGFRGPLLGPGTGGTVGTGGTLFHMSPTSRKARSPEPACDPLKGTMSARCL